MAQIFGDKLLMFHVSAVDANTVTSADNGTDIDLAAFPAKSISSIVAVNDGIHISFLGGTKYEPGTLAATTEQDSDDTTAMVNIVESIEQAIVIVSCTSGKEAAVIEDLWVAMNSVSAGPVLKFDAVNSVYPIENISGVAVRRTTTSISVASD